MIVLPSNGRWVQANGTDRFGSIAASKNITLDEAGYVRLSHSPRAIMNTATDAQFQEPAAIIRSQDYGYFAVTHDACFEINADRFMAVRPTEIATAGVPTGDTQSDAIFNSGLMIVTQDTDVDYYDPAGNTWTDTNISLTNTAQSQHPIRNFHALAAFAIADVNTVKLYSNPVTATPTLLVTLTIPADFYVTSMCYFNQSLYIGTMNRYGGHAFMYVWNGYGTAAQSAFEVGSNIIFDLCVHQNTVFAFIGSGEILRFVSSGFQSVDSLPIHYADGVLSDETNIPMYHNCMKSSGDLLYINVTQNASVTKNVNQPDGLWVFDGELGFAYHRYSMSGALVDIDTIPTTDVNTTTDVITVTAAPPTGTEALYYAAGGTALAPLVDATKYYVIKTSSTTIKLATTKANALAGTAINLTGTGNSSQTLTFFHNTDYGQFFNGRTTAICPIERIIDYPMFGTEILYGGNSQRRTTSDGAVLCSVTPIAENRGYFVTPWIPSDAAEDSFNSLTVKFTKFRSENDKIVIKYRMYDDKRDTILDTGTRWLATWTSSTTFTTTETEFSTAQAGDEIEFLSGGGGGILAHISTISESSGTYTVTIDETYDFYESGDTCRFVFRNWIKLGTISTTSVTNGVLHDDQGYARYNFGGQLGGKQIQFKLELRGTGTSVEQIIINDTESVPA